MSKSRSQKAMRNTFYELLLEIVTAVCGFILPRMILSSFGSAYNGITTSISQFIGCIALLKSGIGGVTRAALYGPLAKHDSIAISQVTNATDGFLKKIATAFMGAMFLFACVYPLMVSESFSWFFAFSLVLILSISTFAQYYFGLTYQMVLQADQKNYIISLATIATTILNTAISVIMIKLGFGIHVVKLASACVFILPPIFYNIYVKKHYQIDTRISPNYDLIAERWDAFGHQVAAFVNQNTDIMIATLFLNISEVSVYSIYYMIVNTIQKAVKAVSTGITASFGNMIAQKEEKTLYNRFCQYESLIFYISTVLLISASILVTPFVLVYTRGILDADYNRPVFGYLICIAVFFTCIKLPYEQMVYAAGAFRSTRNGAFMEAAINIATSIALVRVIGLNGLVIGTIIALFYRSMRYGAVAKFVFAAALFRTL